MHAQQITIITFCTCVFVFVLYRVCQTNFPIQFSALVHTFTQKVQKVTMSPKIVTMVFKIATLFSKSNHFAAVVSP